MFQWDWNNNKKNIGITIPNIVKYDFSKVEKIQFSFWAEHCLECSAPKCFKTCEHFEKRQDGRCKRTFNGQQKIENEANIVGVSSHFKFLKWSKIETYIYNDFITIDEYNKIEKDYEKKINNYNNLKFLNPKSIFNNLNYYKITRNKNRTQQFTYSDIYLLEIFSHEQYDYNLVIEGANIEWKVIARSSVLVKPGFNSFVVDYNKIAPENTNVVRIYPENNRTPEITIINSEFLKLVKKPSNKVKCVAWDLDNTIWNGVLSEVDDIKKLSLREGVKETIIELDKRGILQTIVSKNDYSPAMNALEHFGLSNYFLYPAINWGRKSANIEKIAKELNINIDTFLFIDDSSFEREEVSNAFPQVRIYDENTSILDLKECDVPITDDAIHRREMYQVEAKRKIIQAEYGDNYLDFLKSCDIEVNIGYLLRDEVINRCFELVNRTNQLNISGHRYMKEEFFAKLSNGRHMYFECKDKFGSYGIVGYISFSENGEELIIDELAISCRIAQKHIEKAIMYYLVNSFKVQSVIVKFIKTSKNNPMYECIEEMGFVYKDDRFIMDDVKVLINEEIIEIKELK